MKRLILLLVLSLMILTVPTGIFAESTYELDTGTGFLQNWTAGGDVILPSELDGTPLKGIASRAFRNRADIQSLVIPEPVESLGYQATDYLQNLTSLTLPQTLTAINDQNVYSCHALEQIVIPERVACIGKDCFCNCSRLISVTFEGPCPYIDPSAFTYLPQETVFYVPDNEIEAYRAALPRGVNIMPSGRNATRTSYLAPESEFSFDTGSGTITGYSGHEAVVEIPRSIHGIPVTAIGSYAFEDVETLYMVILPEGVTSIGEGAFDGCDALFHVHFPSTLRTISAGAFSRFSGHELFLPEGLETIGGEAFRGAAIRKVAFPDSLRTIGYDAFYFSSLEEATFPAGLESIGSGAFAKSSLNYLCFRGNVLPQIASDAFDSISLKDIDVSAYSSAEEREAIRQYFAGLGYDVQVWRAQNPYVEYADIEHSTYQKQDTGVFMTGYTGDMTRIRPFDTVNQELVTGIADSIFEGNRNILSFAVPHSDAFTTIGNRAFAGSSVQHVDLFDSVATIGDAAFQGADQLTSIVLPASLTSIGDGAFADCTRLHSITILCDAALLPPDTFQGCPLVDTITAPGYTTEELFTRFGLTQAQTRPDSEQTRFAGNWYLNQIERGGERINAADLQLIDQLTLMADGTVHWRTRLNAEDGVWYTYAGGQLCVDTDSRVHIMSQPEQGVLIENLGNEVRTYRNEPPVPTPQIEPLSDQDYQTYGGTWYGQTVTLNGQEMDASVFGNIELILNRDGTATLITGDEQESLFWRVENQRIVLTDGTSDNTLNPLADRGWLELQLDESVSLTLDRQPPAPGFTPAATIAVPNASVAFGVWNTRFVQIGGMLASADTIASQLTEYIGSDWTLVLTENTMKIFGNDVTGTYEFRDGAWYSLIQDDSGLPVSSIQLCEDGLMTFTGNGGQFYLELESRQVPAIPANSSTAPEAQPAVAADDCIGVWYLSTITMNGSAYAAGDFGLSMVLSIQADGTVTAAMDDETQQGTWSRDDTGTLHIIISESEELFTLQDGSLLGESDGMIMEFTREAPAESAAIPAEIIALDAPEALYGDWKASYVFADDARIPAEAALNELGSMLGMTALDITVSADGARLFGNDTLTPLTFTGGHLESSDASALGPILHMCADGTMLMEYFGVSFVCDRTSAPAAPSENNPPATVAPAPAGHATDRTEIRYVCTQMSSAGYAIDVSIMGEYSVVFHADGTCDFVLSGTPLTLEWYLEGDHYMMPYLSGDTFEFIPEGNGFTLDFYGSMLMLFEPAV